MNEVGFLAPLHTITRRDYLARMNAEKPYCCEVAKQWGEEYWDGDRKYGYGGYHYDGRWMRVAQKMAVHYDLNPMDRILDIGCGKGHLLYEFGLLLPSVEASGVDISQYAHHHAKEGVAHFYNSCTSLPYEDDSQDFVYSINVFHNLGARELKRAVEEMNRVAKPGASKYICVESYRNEQEKFNLQCWALTCEQFHNPDDWKWLLHEYGYDGDIEFIYFV